MIIILLVVDQVLPCDGAHFSYLYLIKSGFFVMANYSQEKKQNSLAIRTNDI